MPDPVRVTPMRGFTAAVAREQTPAPQLQASGIAVGADGAGADRVISIALRHADGTVLVANLSEDAIHRLAFMMAELVDGEGPISPSKVLH